MTDIQAKILLVDDDVRSLMAMETLLTGPGRTVITADSGQEALRQVLRHDFCRHFAGRSNAARRWVRSR